MACAWGGLAGYGVCVLMSYFIGQRHYRVPYPVLAIGGYFALAMALFVLMQWLPLENMGARLVVNTLVIGIYVGVVLFCERSVFMPALRKILHLKR